LSSGDDDLLEGSLSRLEVEVEFFIDTCELTDCTKEKASEALIEMVKSQDYARL